MRVEAWLASGRLKAAWEGTMLRGPGWWAIAAVWSRGPVAAGPLTFAPGDRLLEIYWADRWYNVFRVGTPAPGPAAGGQGDGRGGGWWGERPLGPARQRVKGYYLNLSTPARLLEDPPAPGAEARTWPGGHPAEGAGPGAGRPTPDAGKARLVYVDGVLDAVVLPDGRWQWLDRDEFRQLVQGGGPFGADPAPGAGTTAEGMGPASVPPALPGAGAWVRAARRLAQDLAAGAGPLVANLVPWDDLERVLFQTPASSA